MPPDELTDEEITEDDGTPFQPADEDGDDAASKPIDHPSNDTEVDAQERYDEGEPDEAD